MNERLKYLEYAESVRSILPKGCVEKDTEWKRILAEFFKKLGIIQDKFTGKIDIDFNQGGIRSIIRSEAI